MAPCIVVRRPVHTKRALFQAQNETTGRYPKTVQADTTSSGGGTQCPYRPSAPTISRTGGSGKETRRVITPSVAFRKQGKPAVIRPRGGPHHNENAG